MTTVVGILTAQSPSSASSLTSGRWSTWWWKVETHKRKAILGHLYQCWPVYWCQGQGFEAWCADWHWPPSKVKWISKNHKRQMTLPRSRSLFEPSSPWQPLFSLPSLTLPFSPSVALFRCQYRCHRFAPPPWIKDNSLFVEKILEDINIDRKKLHKLNL